MSTASEQQEVTEKRADPIVKWASFEHIAPFVGFVNDVLTLPFSIIAIISVLVATTDGNTTTLLWTNIHLTPYHALMLWVLSFYAYICFLHYYWKKHKAALSLNFKDFLFKDLITNFKQPVLLFPFVILLLLLAWIIVAADIIGGFIGALFTFGFLGTFVFLIASDPNLHPKTNRDTFVKELNANWPYWDKRLQDTLKASPFIFCSDFKDVMELWSVGLDEIRLLFAKYASAHSTQVRYGTLYHGDDEKGVASALVSKKWLNSAGGKNFTVV